MNCEREIERTVGGCCVKVKTAASLARIEVTGETDVSVIAEILLTSVHLLFAERDFGDTTFAEWFANRIKAAGIPMPTPDVEGSVEFVSADPTFGDSVVELGSGEFKPGDRVRVIKIEEPR